MKNDGKSGNGEVMGLDASGDAALWDLLGRAEQPKVGPYFARRVLREVSLAEDSREEIPAPWWQPASFWSVCRRVGRIALFSSSPVAALLLLFLGLHQNPTGTRMLNHAPSTAAETPAAASAPSRAPGPAILPEDSVAAEDVSAQDVEVIADLDTLLKREQNRLWTEDDTARF